MRSALLRLLLALVPGFGVLSEIPAPTDAPKPRSPAESAAAFQLPDGFRMQLVASEPLVTSPSGLCWDEAGRMFVSELHGYNLEGQLDIEELNRAGKLDTEVRRVQADEKFKKAAEPGTYGVVKLLHDLDGDGVMDAADVWSTNLPPAYGLVPARGGVIVACAPHILFLADADGDGAAEIRETLFTGFKTGPLERGINAPQWGADGWIYFGRGAGGGLITGPNLAQPVNLPGTDFRIRPDGSAIEPVTGGTHTFGFAMTEADDRFTMTTTVPGIHVAPLPWRYLSRNPDAATPSLEASTGDRRAYPLAPPHPWRRRRAEDAAYSKYYRDRYGASDSDASGWFTSACGALVYQDTALPGLNGQYFVCEPSGNLIHRALIRADGPVLTLARAPGEEAREFAASRDGWSHPMSLSHGPDGAIWVVDYYREIIEDYSAIPRHLQQQYGLYAGHDRGRVYRLVHDAMTAAPPPDMSRLDAKALAREVGSGLLWRRQTAQRLLVELGDTTVIPILRALLGGADAGDVSKMSVLRTLDGLGALTPDDVRPFLSHRSETLRVLAMRLGDRWLGRDEGLPILEAMLATAGAERNPRVLLQLALSLGESRDPRAFAVLVRLAREHLGIRWMDVALMSSVRGRGADLLAELLRDPGVAEPLIPVLAQSVGARRDEPELGRTLELASTASLDRQVRILEGLAKGRKNAPRKPLSDAAARRLLAVYAANPSAPLRAAARALEETFLSPGDADDSVAHAANLPRVERVSEGVFRKYVEALKAPRDLKRGHEVFVRACVPCHRVGGEGHEVGPDLLGAVGVPDDSLLKELLMPNERIRPGYETAVVEMADGSWVPGILKDDGATSLALVQANGVSPLLLRKDVKGVRRLATSLMPSFAEGLAPAEAADLLAWLRAQAGGKGSSQSGNQPPPPGAAAK